VSALPPGEEPQYGAELPAEPAPGRTAPDALSGAEYVGFWRRVGGMLIDMLILGVAGVPLLYAAYGEQVFDTDRLLLGPLDFAVSYIFPAIYSIAFWHYKQATPGKMAISALVVDARHGGKVPLPRLVGRYFAYAISAIPFGLGFLWVAFDRRKQGWHDKLVNTVVISEPF